MAGSLVPKSSYVFDPIFHIVSRIQIGVIDATLKNIHEIIYQCMDPDILPTPAYGEVKAIIPPNNPESVIVQLDSYERHSEMILRYSIRRYTFIARCVHIVEKHGIVKKFEVTRSNFASLIRSKSLFSLDFFEYAVYPVFHAENGATTLDEILESYKKPTHVIYRYSRHKSQKFNLLSSKCIFVQFSPDENTIRISTFLEALESPDFCLDSPNPDGTPPTLNIDSLAKANIDTISFLLKNRVIPPRITLSSGLIKSFPSKFQTKIAANLAAESLTEMAFSIKAGVGKGSSVEPAETAVNAFKIVNSLPPKLFDRNTFPFGSQEKLKKFSLIHHINRRTGIFDSAPYIIVFHFSPFWDITDLETTKKETELITQASGIRFNPHKKVDRVYNGCKNVLKGVAEIRTLGSHYVRLKTMASNSKDGTWKIIMRRRRGRRIVTLTSIFYADVGDFRVTCNVDTAPEILSRGSQSGTFLFSRADWGKRFLERELPEHFFGHIDDDGIAWDEIIPSSQFNSNYLRNYQAKETEVLFLNRSPLLSKVIANNGAVYTEANSDSSHLFAMPLESISLSSMPIDLDAVDPRTPTASFPGEERASFHFWYRSTFPTSANENGLSLQQDDSCTDVAGGVCGSFTDSKKVALWNSNTVVAMHMINDYQPHPPLWMNEGRPVGSNIIIPKQGAEIKKSLNSLSVSILLGMPPLDYLHKLISENKEPSLIPPNFLESCFLKSAATSLDFQNSISAIKSPWELWSSAKNALLTIDKKRGQVFLTIETIGIDTSKRKINPTAPDYLIDKDGMSNGHELIVESINLKISENQNSFGLQIKVPNGVGCKGNSSIRNFKKHPLNIILDITHPFFWNDGLKSYNDVFTTSSVSISPIFTSVEDYSKPEISWVVDPVALKHIFTFLGWSDDLPPIPPPPALWLPFEKNWTEPSAGLKYGILPLWAWILIGLAIFIILGVAAIWLLMKFLPDSKVTWILRNKILFRLKNCIWCRRRDGSRPLIKL